MKSTGARSSNELQWHDFKIGYQDSSPSNDHQGNIACWLNIAPRLDFSNWIVMV